MQVLGPLSPLSSPGAGAAPSCDVSEGLRFRISVAPSDCGTTPVQRVLLSGG